jgi:class 3 adenylate cyclase
VRAFGGVLVEHTASRLIWVFGVPQGLDQLPQRAVHSALAIRQMVVEASAPDMPPCPVPRLAVHLGTVRVDRQAADPTVYMLAVGETLTLPVRLLGQAEPGAIVVSPEGGRLVDGLVRRALATCVWGLDKNRAKYSRFILNVPCWHFYIRFYGFRCRWYRMLKA